jgi:hypothetical protein
MSAPLLSRRAHPLSRPYRSCPYIAGTAKPPAGVPPHFPISHPARCAASLLLFSASHYMAQLSHSSRTINFLSFQLWSGATALSTALPYRWPTPACPGSSSLLFLFFRSSCSVGCVSRAWQLLPTQTFSTSAREIAGCPPSTCWCQLVPMRILELLYPPLWPGRSQLLVASGPPS